MKLLIRRPMLLIFLCVFLGTFLFRPLILRTYEKERAPFLKLYTLKEKSCIVQGEVKKVIKGREQTVLVLQKCTIAGFTEGVSEKCGGVRLYVDGEYEYHCGNIVRAYGGFKVFMEAQNPGQFDAYEYYRREHVYANVYGEKVNLISDKIHGISDVFSVLKMTMQRVVEKLYPEDVSGVVYALITGDRSLLLPDTRDEFKRAGISHILAVSGLHISFMCLGFNRLLQSLTVPKKVRDAVTMVFTVVFVLFTGAGISVIRAGIMCIYMLMAENAGKKYDLLSGLFFAGAVELLIYPLEGTTAAFLLSYSAIFGVYAAEKVQAGAFSGMVITLFTLPVTLRFYYEFSTYGVIAGMLVIPATGVLLGAALLSVILGTLNIYMGLLPAGGTLILVKWMEWVSSSLDRLPFSIITVGAPTILGMIVYYLALSLGIWGINRYREDMAETVKRGKENHSFTGIKEVKIVALKRLAVWEAGMATVAILAIVIKLPTSGVTFLSVGQGDAIVFHKNETVIFDCGSSSESSVGEYILGPFLKRMGVNLIDMAVVSHMDSDHTSGIMEILEGMPAYRGNGHFLADYKGKIGIKRLALPRVEKTSQDYEKILTLAQEKNVEIVLLEEGDEIFTKNTRMKCLWPKEAKESDNETSVVMLLSYKKTAYLLTGDATTDSEEKIIALYPEGLREVAASLGTRPIKCVLKVGHHGSKTSTGETLLKWGDFDEAVISVGHYNTYGHPKQEVLDRLVDFGITVHRTDTEGAVKK